MYLVRRSPALPGWLMGMQFALVPGVSIAETDLTIDWFDWFVGCSNSCRAPPRPMASQREIVSFRFSAVELRTNSD